MLEYKLYQRDIKLEFKWNYRIQSRIQFENSECFESCIVDLIYKKGKCLK